MRDFVLAGAIVLAFPLLHCSAQTYPKLNVAVREMAFNRTDGTLYAIDESTRTNILKIDPALAQVISSADAGGPAIVHHLTIAPAGDVLFVYRNDGALLRFRLPDLTLDAQFIIPPPPGSNSPNVNLHGLAISPDDSDLFVASASADATTYIGVFQGGRLLPDRISGYGSLLFLSPTRVVAVLNRGCTPPNCSMFSAAIQELTVDATGLHASGPAYPVRGVFSGGIYGVAPQSLGTRVYTDTGLVVDTSSWQPVARFAGAMGPPFAVDEASKAAYWYNYSFTYGERGVGVFSLETLQLIGKLPFWEGANSIAVCGSVLAVANDLGVSFLPLSAMVPVPRDPPVAKPWNSDGVSRLMLKTGGIALDPARGSLYVSTPGEVGPLGNSLLKLDSRTLEVRDVLPIGSNPGKMSLTDSGQTLHVGLDGSAMVASFDLDAFALKRTTPLSDSDSPQPLPAVSIASVRGVEDVFAACRYAEYGGQQTVVVYSGGRPISPAVSQYCRSVLSGDLPGSVLAAVDPLKGFGTITSRLERLSVNSSGIAGTDQHGVSFAGIPVAADGRRFYTDTGEVWQFGNHRRQGFVALGFYAGAFWPAEGTNFALSPDGSRIFVVVSVRVDGNTTVTAFARDTLLLESVYRFNVFDPDMGVEDNQALYSGALDVVVGEEAIYLQFPAFLFRVPIAALTPLTAQPIVPRTSPSTGVIAITAGIGQFAVVPGTNTLAFTLDDSSPGSGGRVGFWNTDNNEVRLSDFLGGMPRAIGITDDGKELWVEHFAWQAVHRYRLPDFAQVGELFWVDPNWDPIQTVVNAQVGTIQPVPRTLKSMAITAFPLGTMIFDTSAKSVVARRTGGVGPGVFSPEGDRYYALAGGFTTYFHAYTVDATGFHSLTGPGGKWGVAEDSTDNLQFANGRLYTGCGRVIDPETFAIIGDYSVRRAAPDYSIACQPGDKGLLGSTLVLPDVDTGVVYYLGVGLPPGSGRLVLDVLAFDQATYRFIGKMTISTFTKPVQIAKVGSRIAYLTNTGVLGVIDPSPLLASWKQ